MKETNELLKRLKDLGYDSMEEFENDKELHKADLNSDAPALYVGTYKHRVFPTLKKQDE